MRGRPFRECPGDLPLLSKVCGRERAAIPLDALAVAVEEESPSERDEITIASEYYGRFFAWLAQARTLEEWGIRSWAMVYAIRRDRLGDQTLETWRGAGYTKQKAHYYVQDFRRTFGMTDDAR